MLLVLALLCVVGATASGLPPPTARPKSAATSAASRQLVERAGAASRADQIDEAIALLRQAVAAEPAHHDARVTLAAALLDRHPDQALLILTELRDAACRTCLRAVTDFVWRTNAALESASLRGRLEALAKDAHGRPTRITRTADAVWTAFERRDWAALAPYVGNRIELIDGRVSSIADTAVTLAVTGTTDRIGTETSWRGEQVTIPRGMVAEFGGRSINRRRSFMVGGIAAGLVAAVGVGFGISGSGGGGRGSGTGSTR